MAAPELSDDDLEKGDAPRLTVDQAHLEGASKALSTPGHVDQSPRAPSYQDPKDWSMRVKTLYTFILCGWVLSLTFASTAYVASVPALMRHFGVSRLYAVGGVCLFVGGFSSGPLLLGPASDLYGRRPVYIVTGLLYSAASFGAAFAPSAPSLLAFRFLMGAFGSSSINNVIASIADFTRPIERLRLNAFYALFTFFGPAIGPLCGIYIEHYAGFRWNLRVMAIYATLFSCLAALVPETHGPTLSRRAEQARGNHVKVTRQQAVQTFRTAIARPIFYLFTEPIVALVCVYLTLLYSMLYGFFASFGYVYVTIRGFSDLEYGLTYISLGLGFLVGFVLLQILTVVVAKQAVPVADTGHYIAPENRLKLSYPCAIMAPLSLVIFAWTAPYPKVHWIAPCIGEFLFGLSMFGLFVSFIPYLAESYTRYAASALAAGMFTRAFLACFFPLFTYQMFEKMTVQGATMLFAALLAMLAPVPFYFKRHGARLRAASPIAVKDPS